MKAILDFIKRHKILIFLIIISLIRHFLVMHIPLYALPGELYDDNMMYDMAQNILSGNWLGDYTSNTLVKGAFFPLLLAIINKLGLSYISVMSYIYIGACIYFIYTIKDLFKSKISLAVVYTLLIFNPVSFAGWTMQRLYRNGITLAQVLIIIGSMYALYKNRYESKKILTIYGIIGGLTLGTFWQTREDGIWILPFILVVTLIIVINLIIKYKGNKLELLTKLVIILLPLIILKGSLTATKLVNYRVYGVYTYNEINDGYFGKVLQTIYSIKSEENIQYVTATREKITRLYEVSPTLNSIKEHLESSLNGWDLCDRNPGDTQVEDGWFWWALKGGVENAGYYNTAVNSDEFFKKVYEELNQAIEEGKIEKNFSMPSKLMSPWKGEYFGQEFTTLFEFIKYVVSYDTVTTIEGASVQTDEGWSSIRDYEVLTHNYAIYPTQSEKEIKLTGWLLVKDNSDFKITLNRNDTVICDVPRLESEDLYNHFKLEYPELTNTKKCRFDVEYYLKDLKQKDNLYLSVKNENNEEILKIDVKECVKGQISGDNKFTWCFDTLKNGFDQYVDEYKNYVHPYVNTLNNITKIYQYMGLAIAIIAIITFIVMTILLIINKTIRVQIIDTWLLLLGILFSFLVLVAGVSYNHITACNSKFYMYLSGSYPLLIAFSSVSIMHFIENLKSYKNGLKFNKTK